jgi:1,4-alpha-glucan branching enzyme
MTPVPRAQYRIGVPESGEWREILNTDAGVYGGGNMGNGSVVWSEDAPSHGHPASLALTLPPLSTILLKKV